MDCKEVRRPRIRVIIKKASMGEESMIGPEIVQEKDVLKDEPELNEMRRKNYVEGKKIEQQQKLSGQKRRASKAGGKAKDIEEMWGWLNSENGQETYSDNTTQTKSEEDSEIKEMFDRVKRKKTNEKSPQEIALRVEKVMAMLEVAAEDDAELNRQEKPAIRKIQMLPLLTDALSNKKLQAEFLDHGVLNLLKSWLDLLPDGSLPNAIVRASVLNILTNFPLDIEKDDRREQLKKSGLGKVIMFLSQSVEETTANRKLAKRLIEKWSRTIYNKSTRFSDLRDIEEDNVLFIMKPSVTKLGKKQSPTMGLREADLDLEVRKEPKPSHQSSSTQRASRPEATPSVYSVRPQSNLNRGIVKIYPRQEVQGERRERIEKKLKRLKASKKKPFQATKLSAEGRRMVTYF